VDYEKIWKRTLKFSWPKSLWVAVITSAARAGRVRIQFIGSRPEPQRRPLSGAGFTTCNYGQVNFGGGCAVVNPQTWAATCSYSGGSVITSSDGTTVCRMTIQVRSKLRATRTIWVLAAAAVSPGIADAGDDVSVSASGHWGNNTATSTSAGARAAPAPATTRVTSPTRRRVCTLQRAERSFRFSRRRTFRSALTRRA